jgi:hypothetical protein
MNILSNLTLIKRNGYLAQGAMLGGLLVLGIGMFISFRYPEQFTLSLVALLLGFILSQIGIYFSNRFGRRPRVDELLNQALKGLDGKYTLYHYLTPVSHLLVGPVGVWILLVRHQRGLIQYQNGRWRQKGGNLYLKLFAQDSLGRPDMDIQLEIGKLQRFLASNLPEDQIPPIQAALVFSNPKVSIDISEEETPPALTVNLSKLKESIRKSSKGKTLTADKIQSINKLFPTEDK